MPEAPGDRYLPDEVITLYRLEPGLRDIIVEGPIDAGFFGWYLRDRALEARVFAVDDYVYIEATAVLNLGLEVGSRGRAMALAHLIAQESEPAQRAVTVVVDADLALVSGPIPLRCHCLLMTDDCALENYVLNERPMRKLLSVHLHSDLSATVVIGAILPALNVLLGVRSFLKSLGIGIMNRFEQMVTFDGETVHVDVGEILLRSVASVPKRDRLFQMDQMSEWVDFHLELAKRSGASGRGHDIPQVLSRYLSSKGVRAPIKAIEDALLLTLEAADMDQSTLFAAVRERLT